MGMGGDIVPGPNPETQMGIDEVLGWGAMEAYAGAQRGVHGALDKAEEVFDRYEWDRETKKSVVKHKKKKKSDPKWGDSPRRKISPTQEEYDKYRYKRRVTQ